LRNSDLVISFVEFGQKNLVTSGIGKQWKSNFEKISSWVRGSRFELAAVVFDLVSGFSTRAATMRWCLGFWSITSKARSWENINRKNGRNSLSRRSLLTSTLDHAGYVVAFVVNWAVGKSGGRITFKPVSGDLRFLLSTPEGVLQCTSGSKAVTEAFLHRVRDWNSRWVAFALGAGPEYDIKLLRQCDAGWTRYRSSFGSSCLRMEGSDNAPRVMDLFLHDNALKSAAPRAKTQLTDWLDALKQVILNAKGPHGPDHVLAASADAVSQRKTSSSVFFGHVWVCCVGSYC
jgi:hypothetical protein